MTLMLIECGTSMSSPYHTGIQKVVRSIVRESKSIGDSMRISCIPVSFENNDLIRIQNTEDQKNATIEGQSFFIQLLFYFINFLGKVNALASTYFFSKTLYKKIRRNISPWVHKLANYAQDKTRCEWKSMLRTYELEQEQLGVSASPPILLLLDSTWNQDIWRLVDDFKASGGHVCVVLYDLIPFLYPDTVDEITRVGHTTWWNSVPDHVDSVICISKSVRDDFLSWQKNGAFSKLIPMDKVGYFYLGAECNQNDPVIQAFSLETPTYIVVGSLEPRKNHYFILDAFDLLWEQDYNVNLLIVGGHGWKCDRLLERIENHIEFGHRLILIRDATDRDLELLYQKSSALIVASIAEGFGLPIVEAFQRGTKVICSDIPVFREVAEDNAVYFDLEDASLLAHQITQNLTSVDVNVTQKRITVKKWITWKESTEQLLSKALLYTRKSISRHRNNEI